MIFLVLSHLAQRITNTWIEELLELREFFSLFSIRMSEVVLFNFEGESLLEENSRCQ